MKVAKFIYENLNIIFSQKQINRQFLHLFTKQQEFSIMNLGTDSLPSQTTPTWYVSISFHSLHQLTFP